MLDRTTAGFTPGERLHSPRSRFVVVVERAEGPTPVGSWTRPFGAFGAFAQLAAAVLATALVAALVGLAPGGASGLAAELARVLARVARSLGVA